MASLNFIALLCEQTCTRWLITKGSSVEWALFVAIATGVLMGSLLRAFALVVSCGLVLALVIAVGLSAELSATRIAVWSIALTCAHQISYLAGLLVHHFWQRLKGKRGIGRAEHS